MIKNVFLLEEAVKDMKDGKRFYNDKEPGVGEYFWDSLISDIESLVIYAGVHRKKFGLYQMFAKRFSYSIFYEIKNDIAYVVAVLPMVRNPDWIKARIYRNLP